MITLRRALALSFAGHLGLFAIIGVATWLGLAFSCRPPVSTQTMMLQNVSMVQRQPEPTPEPPAPEPEPEPELVREPEPRVEPPPPPPPREEPRRTETPPPPPPREERVITPEPNPEQERELEEMRRRREQREQERLERERQAEQARQEELERQQREELERLRREREEQAAAQIPQEQSVAVEQSTTPLGAYASRLIASISRHWHSSGQWANASSYPRIAFKISRSGAFSDFRLVSSSGNAEFDAAALAALRDYPQGPRLPDFITEVPLEVTVVMLPR